MKISQLFTRRNCVGQNYALPIIYEWEDIISRDLNIPIVDFPSFHKLFGHLGFHFPLFAKYKKSFRFVINGRDYDDFMNSKHVIPCIIDFFEKEEQLQEFYKKHTDNKIVLVSSPFDYKYLKDRNCPLNIQLFAYSLSDKYALTSTLPEKKYDIVLMGRQDPLLYSFFKEYVKSHPEVSYVKRGKDLDNDFKKSKDYYLNGKVCLGAIETRDEFMKLQAQGRVTLYGVQGYYDGFTKGFYHMTPHFLEIIACASHVIAHYPSGEDGIDANFYEFEKFSPSVDTYEEFEKAMDYALSRDIDIDMYSAYLQKHYTSTRVKQLVQYLRNI